MYTQSITRMHREDSQAHSGHRGVPKLGRRSGVGPAASKVAGRRCTARGCREERELHSAGLRGRWAAELKWGGGPFQCLGVGLWEDRLGRGCSSGEG